jgi:hypothetical protein
MQSRFRKRATVDGRERLHESVRAFASALDSIREDRRDDRRASAEIAAELAYLRSLIEIPRRARGARHPDFDELPLSGRGHDEIVVRR